MKRETRAPKTAASAARNERKLPKRPPDTDGLFKRASARARKVIAMYDELNPDLGEDYLLSNLFLDLMHLCDREPKLGDILEEQGRAVHIYLDLVAENMWALDWFIDFKEARKAAEQMLFPDV